MNTLEYPKADLHVHLNGAIPTQVVEQLVKKYDITIPDDFDFPNDLRVLEPVKTLLEYFKPWFVLKQLPVGRECLNTMIKSIIQDAVKDNVRYMELRHSITAMSKNNEISHEESIEWILAAMEEVSEEFRVDCRLIVSISRYKLESKTAWDLLHAIRCIKYQGRVVGIDLTGDEDSPIPSEIQTVLKTAKEELGLGVTVHAGETGNSENVRWAIEECGASRIGHGLAVVKDKTLLDQVLENDICLEICLTSNLRTGTVSNLCYHQLHSLIESNVPFVLCSDNPAIHNATLSTEYNHFLGEFGREDIINEMFKRQCRFAFGDVKTYD